MSYFNEWQDLGVYSGKVKSHTPPKDILKHFNLENLRKILDQSVYHDNLSLDSIVSAYSVRYALNHILSNLTLKFDRELTSYVRSNEISDFESNHQIGLQRMFNSEFFIMYLSPNDYKDYGNSNDPSYYHLFLSLLSSVNSVLLESNEINLAELKVSCDNIDSCLFSKVSNRYINDILSFYRKVGAIDLSEGYIFSYEGVKGVVLLDKDKLTNLGATRSDIGFSLSPSGFLMPYHLGILSYLCEYNVINCTVPLGGASSGSLSVSASVVLNGFINCMNVIERSSNRLRSTHQKILNNEIPKDNDSEDPILSKNLDDILTAALSEILGEGSYQFINDRIGSVTIGYSVIRRFRFKSVTNSQFLSVSDLIDCLRVSSYIPILSSKDFVYYKGEACFDGQLSLNKNFGCIETDSKRVIRVNPYSFTSGKFGKQRLLNEYITPHLTDNDQFLTYYIQLKSIIYQLNIRKLTLESLDMASEFKNELIHSINLYSFIASSLKPKMKIDHSDQNSYTDTREYNKLSALWNSRSMIDLFVLLTKYETTLEVHKYNLSKYEVTENMDIVKTLGSSKFLKKPIQTSTVTLLTYLYLQLSQFLTHSTPEHLPDDTYSFLSYYISIRSSNLKDNSNRTVRNLVNLLTLLVPPLALIYNYCSSSRLICNNVPKKQLFNISLYSSDDYKLRFFYDLGKTDSFRWIIQEYIKFENYLYLRILQIMKFRTNHNNSNTLETIDAYDSQTDMLLHNKQKNLLNKNLKLVIKDNLDDQLISSSVHYKLFLRLNNAVRNVILENSIDSHFSHILSHSHFWNYNKHYRY